METRSFTQPIPQIKYLVKNKLWAQVLVALFVGLLVGLALGPETGWVEKETSEVITDWLSIPANLFLKIIQMIIVPLIFASIIRGLTSSGSIEQLQKLGLGAAVYFVITTAIALTIGIAIATTIEPGNFIDSDLIRESFGIEDLDPVESYELSIHDIPQSIVGLVPSNPLSSFMSGEMLSIIIFALIVGVAMITLPHKSSKPILDLLESIQDFTMKVVSWAMRLAPFAAFGLMAGIVSKIGLSALTGLGAYMATVVAGLFVMMIVYVIIIKFFAKRPLASTLAIIKEPQLLAFSTSSSAATMPVSIKTAEEKLKVKPKVSQFIIPLGATINMDGTAMYQIIAVFFLAQLFDVNLSFTTIILIALTSLAASIGAPSAPGTGIVILSTILIAAGVPAVGVVLLLGVDRILDMTRTMVNVTGDLTACMFFDKRAKIEEPPKVES
ncbi:dicarboxylate/amino acid:cation symporter [Candidatus Nitrosopumilus sp. SW]|uniref:dicarboxylate/amino acid:cation symporter n=1 Tax=Candidatus Nitrosopumilus sp. SW TaxID=2508726 RepID=UPI0011541400|nr:dicarboxylate/amino acid:cation symporter [Candidatus Nitrosopumilus sp. SW]QDI89357.1 dicarboxylate/amino acid:cation symporter [Candidatus Nitrosopumilus sp. SW]